VSRPGLVDTHCHLQVIGADDPAAVDTTIAAATEAGVDRLITIGLGDDNRAVVELAAGRDGVYATVGWHPHEATPPNADQLAEIRELALLPGVVAIGEVGLDYYWRPGYHEVPVDVQKESLRLMLGLAREVRLPAVIHNRMAHGDTLALLQEFDDLTIVMHAFSGDVDFARECAERGIYMSIAGPITYPSAQPLREAVATIPLELLLVETDAPFLPPQPWRGKPSSPAMMVETARRLAEVKGTTLDELAPRLLANSESVFRLGVDLATLEP
jgi:TatD DNase family protein